MHALAMLSKLSLLEDSDWDLGHVRQILAFALVIDRVLGLNQELEAQMMRPQNLIRHDMFARKASQMTQLKERYLSRLAILEGGVASQPGVVDDPVEANSTLIHGELFEGLDKPFWQDVIADWNAFPENGA